MPREICVYGITGDPSGNHHRAVASRLARDFYTVIIPSGPRPKEIGKNDTPAIHRAVMADLTFGDIPNTEVDLSDLEQKRFSTTDDLWKRFSRNRDTVWLALGSDWFQTREDGLSEIQRWWENGKNLWKKANFAVIAREGYDLNPQKLPPHHRIFRPGIGGSSKRIRQMTFLREDTSNLVTPRVREYIERYGLYRGKPPGREAELFIEDPRPVFVVDEKNPRAGEFAQTFKHLENQDNPNLILTFGGDGMLLHTVRRRWRQRLPFVGVNLGTRGFLLNRREIFQKGFDLRHFLVRQHPLLYVETEKTSGEVTSSLAFNDAWIRIARGQTPWIQLRRNNQILKKKIPTDMVLISTPAGSTAYPRSMGETPLRPDEQSLFMIADYIPEVHRLTWHLDLDDEMEIVVLDPEKRPVVGFVDGVEEGPVARMKIRVSRIAAAEIAKADMRPYRKTGKISTEGDGR